MVAATRAEIWVRVIDSEKADLSPDAARAFPALRFKQADRDRMNQLAALARTGRMTPREQVELQEYLRATDLLALLKSKARQSLRRIDDPPPQRSSGRRRPTNRSARRKAAT